MLVEGVSGDQDGLGYFGFSYYEQNQDKLNLVASTAARAASPRARRRSSPASTRRCRGRCSCTRSAAALQKPEVKAFMQYVVDNYDTIAEQAQIVPMDARRRRSPRRRSQGDRLGAVTG